jgi:hypothetical protein
VKKITEVIAKREGRWGSKLWCEEEGGGSVL